PKVDTKGKFQWISLKGNLNKYVGHRAYLEFIDNGNGSLILDEIRQSSIPAVPETPVREKREPLSASLLAEVKEGASLVSALPAPRFAVAMAEGPKETAQVYVRGSHRSLGEEVPPRFLEALGGETGTRLDLANEVTSPENPLTSRVIANRIWHHLFGRGLVSSVDDFGPMGQVPTHPELLDWLASEFVERGWSIKGMIREIVLSSTYRQATEPHPNVSPGHLAEVDPSNLLLSRMPVKRLTGEVIRDSILAVSGTLDETRYGPSIPTHRTDFMTGRGGRESGPLDGGGRRSIYGAVYRNFLSPFLLTFDVPSPFGPKGRRSVSNVPAQALVLMNDPFVVEQGVKWAKQFNGRNLSPEARVDEMFRSALGRDPRPAEREKLLAYVDEAGGTAESWAHLGHVLFNTKEFIFIP
ncbi:MAG: DUF1553 domain-containing protein, partial [Verrucomicrobiota bacterium]